MQPRGHGMLQSEIKDKETQRLVPQTEEEREKELWASQRRYGGLFILLPM